MENMSAQGWLYKSNFDDSDQARQMLIARKMAEIVNAADIILHSQWLPGEDNIVFYCLSCDHHLPDPDLVNMLRISPPKHIVEDFTINQLPIKIISFIFSLVQNPPEPTPSSKEKPLKFCQQVSYRLTNCHV
jgi:hypothetical protein